MDAYKMQLMIYSDELVQAIQWDPDDPVCQSLDCMKDGILEASSIMRNKPDKGDWIVFREDSSRQILSDNEFQPRITDLTEVNTFLRARIRPMRKDSK